MQPNEKRIIFTADSRFALTRPTATSGAGDAGQPDQIATLRGYAIVWNQLSSDRGGYVVRLLPGSAVPTPLVHAFWNHDNSRPLGDTGSGTLRILPADAVGIPVEILLPDTTYGRDTEELVETRRVRGMSFAMTGPIEATEKTENGQTILEVSRFSFDEVTVTCSPAFVTTTIEVAEDDRPEDRQELAKKSSKSIEELAALASKLELLKWSMMSL